MTAREKAALQHGTPSEMTNRCHVTDGYMLSRTNGCIKTARCNHFCNRKAVCIRGLHSEDNRGLHSEDNRRLLCIRRLHSEDNPGLHCIRGLHSEDNPGLLCIRGLQFEDKNDQVNNTDLSRTKRRICARRFPKGERKALWWGDGAKPHILKCCIHRLQFENNRGLNCIRRLQYSTTRGCFASVGCTSGI